uniref:Large ribosomal subunit protein uL22c n=1 Tax=Rhipsalis baccifera TaxID=722799 RepID=A0A7L8ZQZ9_9CARY|nr:ribosomal protein L22 [Rhipsalis baccifera]QOI72717.1 ribosomal protein L22 [Rhipsalis baccifera]
MKIINIKKFRQKENDENSELNRKRGTYAFGRYMPMSAHKAQRVVNQIRGRSYDEASMILGFMPYRACYPIWKLLNSAAANAEYKKGFHTTELFIKKVQVNKGPMRKKSKPRAQGRSDIIKRPTCHITIVLQHIFFMKESRKKKRTLYEKDIQQATVTYESLRKNNEILRLITDGEIKIR